MTPPASQLDAFVNPRIGQPEVTFFCHFRPEVSWENAMRLSGRSLGGGTKSGQSDAMVF